MESIGIPVCSHHICWNLSLVGGFSPPPLKNIRLRQLGWWHSQYFWENKIDVPNHQPDHDWNPPEHDYGDFVSIAIFLLDVHSRWQGISAFNRYTFDEFWGITLEGSGMWTQEDSMSQTWNCKLRCSLPSGSWLFKVTPLGLGSDHITQGLHGKTPSTGPKVHETIVHT